MKQTSATPGTAWFPVRLKCASASIAVVALFCSIYAVAPHNRELIGHLFGSVSSSFTGGEFLFAAALVYSCFVGVYHLLAPDLGLTKSVRFFRVLWAFFRSPAAVLRQGLDRDDRFAVLATLLKGFFAPVMVMSLMTLCVDVVTHAAAIAAEGGLSVGFLTLFNQHAFWILTQTIFFVDVLLFTVGYLIESPVWAMRFGPWIRPCSVGQRGYCVIRRSIC